MNSGTSETRLGVLYGIGAYGIWGAFPLYFRLLDASGPVEILMYRVLFALVACIALTLALRQWREVAAVARSRRTSGLLALAALLIAVNWGVYVYAVNSGQVVEGALGYFINPLITVALGVLVLRERLRPLQWTAVGVGLVAVVVLTVAYGRLPYIALTLALSFGTYGLLKNRVGGRVGAVTGLTVETLALAPLALAGIVYLGVTGQSTFTENPPWQGILLATLGVVTVIPLLLFAATARRVPLTMVGLLQYITPCLQLLVGVTLLDEHMPPARWAGFALVWLALVLLTTDTLRQSRRPRARTPEPVPV